MSSNVINVKKLMKQFDELQISKRKTKKFKISYDAIQEEIKYLEALIEVHMQTAMEYAHSNERKTVLEEDIINAHSRRDA